MSQHNRLINKLSLKNRISNKQIKMNIRTTKYQIMHLDYLSNQLRTVWRMIINAKNQLRSCRNYQQMMLRALKSGI